MSNPEKNKRRRVIVSESESDSSSSSTEKHEKLVRKSEATKISKSSSIPLLDLSRDDQEVLPPKNHTILKDFYIEQGNRVECKICKRSGRFLSKFGIQHSVNMHALEHAAAITYYAENEIRNENKRAEILGRNQQTSDPKQTKITSFVSRSCNDGRSFSLVRTDTVGRIEDEIAIFLFRNKFPFRAVETMQPLVDAVIAHCATTSSRFVVQKRDKFATKVHTGILKKVAEGISTKHQDALINSGGVLGFDGFRDVSSVGKVLLVVSTTAGSDLVATELAIGVSKDADWNYKMLDKFLNYEFNHSDLDESARVNDKVEILNEFYKNFLPYIFALSSDHATAEQGALSKMEEQGFVSMGDPSHAVSNIAKHTFGAMEQMVEMVREVSKLFTYYGIPKGLLSQSAYGGALLNDSGTRFLNLPLMAIKILNAWSSLEDVVGLNAFKVWKNQKADDAGRDLAEKVTEYVHDPDAKLAIEFLVALSKPFLLAVRLFDAALPSSLPLVYYTLGFLQENVLAAISDPKFKSITTPALVSKLCNKLLDCVDFYDRPAYSAAFLLDPRNSAYIDTLRKGGTGADDQAKSEELASLIQDTQHVCKIMALRFDVYSVTARERPLNLENPDQADGYEASCRIIDRHVNNFVAGTDQFSNKKDAIFNENELPSSWWRNNYPRNVLTKMACRLVDACVGTTSNERMNYVDKRTRRDQRSRLSYVQTESLVIINKFLNSTRRNNDADIKRMQKYAFKFQNLTDKEEIMLDEFKKRLEEEEEKDANANENIENNHGSEEEEEEVDDGNNTIEDDAVQRFSKRRNKGNKYKALLKKLCEEVDGFENDNDDSDYEG